MVKMVTHHVLSLGVTFFVLSLLHSSLFVMLPAFVAAYIADLVIDAVGHSNSGVPRRTWITHTPYTSPLSGGIVGLIVGLLANSVLPISVGWCVLAGVIASLCHLAADLPTQAGIFLTPHRRIAFGHFRYNNMLLNFGLILLGVGLFYAALVEGSP
jgi:hypothetical protein